MKQITKFQASDGAEFSTEKNCNDYENIIREVKRIMKPLGPLPKDKSCNFANGRGYIPHDPELVERLKKELVEYGRKVLHIDGDVSYGQFGRYADDSGVSPLYRAWSRLANCDKRGREWGQQFYANNPNEGKQEPYKETK